MVYARDSAYHFFLLTSSFSIKMPSQYQITAGKNKPSFVDDDLAFIEVYMRQTKTQLPKLKRQ